MTGRPAPSEELLLAYAAGTLSPPEAVVVSTCLAMRPEADGWVRRLQGVGGAILDDLADIHRIGRDDGASERHIFE